jgi:uncharacterized membrane protein YebE (DUF533 family)
VEHPGLYFAIAVLALIVAFWLALQIIGFVFKLIFFALIALIAYAAYQAWQASRTKAQ